MESKEPARFATIQPVLDDLLPIIRSFAVGRYAVAISGSYGKGRPDNRSDIDLRLYADLFLRDCQIPRRPVAFPGHAGACRRPGT